MAKDKINVVGTFEPCYCIQICSKDDEYEYYSDGFRLDDLIDQAAKDVVDNKIPLSLLVRCSVTFDEGNIEFSVSGHVVNSGIRAYNSKIMNSKQVKDAIKKSKNYVNISPEEYIRAQIERVQKSQKQKVEQLYNLDNEMRRYNKQLKVKR